MNKNFKDGFEKTAFFTFKHNINLDDQMKNFIREEMRAATSTLKPRIGAGTIFGGALLTGLGLAAGDYIAGMFRRPANTTVETINRVSPVQLGVKGDMNEEFNY
jgi:hypothetical protein